MRLSAPAPNPLPATQYATYAALKAAAAPADGTVVYVTGYYAGGDHSGARYRYSSSETQADDGGSIVRPNSVAANAAGRWLLVNVLMDVQFFGAVPDAVVNAGTGLIASGTDNIGPLRLAVAASVNQGRPLTGRGNFAYGVRSDQANLRFYDGAQILGSDPLLPLSLYWFNEQAGQAGDFLIPFQVDNHVRLYNVSFVCGGNFKTSGGRMMGSHFLARGVTIDNRRDVFSGTAHGLAYGLTDLQNHTWGTGCLVTRCTNGAWRANESRAIERNVRFRRMSFVNNVLDDLTLNSPGEIKVSGTTQKQVSNPVGMIDVTVEYNTFVGGGKGGNAGPWAVSAAHVKGLLFQGNNVSGYSYAATHYEDDTQAVSKGNTFANCNTSDLADGIQTVLSGSTVVFDGDSYDMGGRSKPAIHGTRSPGATGLTASGIPKNSAPYGIEIKANQTLTNGALLAVLVQTLNPVTYGQAGVSVT